MIVLFLFLSCSLQILAAQKDIEAELAECGKSRNQETNLELGTYTSEPGNFPWHVAVYKYDKSASTYEHICGGTIISKQVVITAAKCVYDSSKKATIPPNFFKIVAGKLAFDWSTPDSNAQEVDVININVPETYFGDITSYAENIAVINLAKDFDFNQLIGPACLDWTVKWSNSLNHVVQTAGWGLKSGDRYSPLLKEAYLEYVNIVDCRKKYSSIRYLRFINYDKICVLTPDGRRDHDTGSGLVQKIDGRYNLIGVMSAFLINDFTPATNLSRHLSWIQDSLKEFKNKKRCISGFHCLEGSCIDENLMCDGTKNCPDGSDEFNCPTTRDIPISKEKCLLPAQRGGVSYTRLNCDRNCELKAGVYVRANDIVKINCGLGFGPTVEAEYESKYICSNRTWFPKDPECIKLCAALKKEHLTIECTYNREKVSCDGYTRPATIAKYKCNKFYRPNYDPLVSDSTTCKIGGTWSDRLPSCIPVCGIENPVNSAQTTLAHAKKAFYGKYPWHVGVYKKSLEKEIFENICGGSLIRENFILTAAHCMFDPASEVKFKENDLKVAGGKFLRDLYIKETHQVVTDVLKIITPETYAGFNTRYEEDVALLKTSTKFVFSDFVLPVCLDLSQHYTIRDNLKGTVIGWGLTETDEYSKYLREASLPVMMTVKCRKRYRDFITFITSDKFCVIHQNGTGTQEGDSGGGMTFQFDGRYYVYGIVSVKKRDSNLFSVFTDVKAHMDWITTSIKTYSLDGTVS